MGCRTPHTICSMRCCCLLQKDGRVTLGGSGQTWPRSLAGAVGSEGPGTARGAGRAVPAGPQSRPAITCHPAESARPAERSGALAAAGTALPARRGAGRRARGGRGGAPEDVGGRLGA